MIIQLLFLSLYLHYKYLVRPVVFDRLGHLYSAQPQFRPIKGSENQNVLLGCKQLSNKTSHHQRWINSEFVADSIQWMKIKIKTNRTFNEQKFKTDGWKHWYLCSHVISTHALAWLLIEDKFLFGISASCYGLKNSLKLRATLLLLVLKGSVSRFRSKQWFCNFLISNITQTFILLFKLKALFWR